MNCEQVAAPVDLAVNIVRANAARGNDDWQVEIDVSITGMQVDVGSQCFRKLESDRAIAGFETPAGGNRRTSAGAGLHTAVAGMQVELVETAIQNKKQFGVVPFGLQPV